MSVPTHRQELIAKTRKLAATLIQASDTFNALAAELKYTGGELPPEQGGFTQEEFYGPNADLQPSDILTFYQTLGAILSALTDEQKAVVYKLKGSANLFGPLPPPPPVV